MTVLAPMVLIGALLWASFHLGKFAWGTRNLRQIHPHIRLRLTKNVVQPDNIYEAFIAVDETLTARFGPWHNQISLIVEWLPYGSIIKTRLAAEVYGRLGQGARWDWAHVVQDVSGFRRWLDKNASSMSGKFGNHRKYESRAGNKNRGTGAAVASYVDWVHPPRTHSILFADASKEAGGDPKIAFDRIYRSLGQVNSFGRTAKFDYLTMIGKLGLAPIEPGSTYLSGATGPRRGANLLFGGSVDANLKLQYLEGGLIELGQHLSVGMQVLEDSLCNWQKKPDTFVAFRG